jgi:hypothetical protein
MHLKTPFFCLSSLLIVSIGKNVEIFYQGGGEKNQQFSIPIDPSCVSTYSPFKPKMCIKNEARQTE